MIMAVAEVAAKNHSLELTFLGTRGEIEARSRRHRRHSALLVEHKNARIMIDCGADWLGRLDAIAPTAIVLTHAHLDHVGGLAHGVQCPIYATSKRQYLLVVPQFEYLGGSTKTMRKFSFLRIALVGCR